MAVPYPHAPLLGRVDHEEPAKRPEGLPTQGALGLLLDDNYLFAAIGEFRRSDKTGQTGPDDDDIGLFTPAAHSPSGSTPMRRNQRKTGIMIRYMTMP